MLWKNATPGSDAERCRDRLYLVIVAPGSRPWLIPLVALVVLGCAALAAQPIEEPTAGSPSECAECHDEIVATFTRDAHSALDSIARDSLAPASTNCKACHGQSQDHLLEGGGFGTIFGFSDAAPASEVVARCQNCHYPEHPGFDVSSHGRIGMSCITCHTIHGPAAPFAGLRRWQDFRSAVDSDRISESCRGCHSDVFSQFDFNERHRLQEGILDCTDCHDPHRPSTRSVIGGFEQGLCADCHTDKEGPFVFEHGTSRVEGCQSCHAAHGSPNRHMLSFQNVADLCYACHAVVPGFHATLAPDNQCTNCHSTIHGSNLDAFFLR